MHYRIIQGSINNVIKHAKATHFNITLNRTAADISAIIKDNGIGFDSSKAEDFTGIGLKNIQPLIAYLKGTIAYNWEPGQGTAVNIFVLVE
jgi:two-component system NarL family sensor kinase